MPDILTLNQDGTPIGFLSKKSVDQYHPSHGSLKLFPRPHVSAPVLPFVLFEGVHTGCRREKKIEAGWVLRIVEGQAFLGELGPEVFVYLAESKFVIPDIWYGARR